MFLKEHWDNPALLWKTILKVKTNYVWLKKHITRAEIYERKMNQYKNMSAYIIVIRSMRESIKIFESKNRDIKSDGNLIHFRITDSELFSQICCRVPEEWFNEIRNISIELKKQMD